MLKIKRPRKQLCYQRGYSLVEVISVVTLTSVVAATAIPRLQALQQNTVAVSAQHIKQSLHSLNQQIYIKAKIRGLEALNTAQLTLDTNTIELRYGFPAANAEGVGQLLDGLGQWHFSTSGSNATAHWVNHQENTRHCVLRYTGANRQHQVATLELLGRQCQ